MCLFIFHIFFDLFFSFGLLLFILAVPVQSDDAWASFCVDGIDDGGAFITHCIAKSLEWHFNGIEKKEKHETGNSREFMLAQAQRW